MKPVCSFCALGFPVGLQPAATLNNMFMETPTILHNARIPRSD